MGNLDIKVVNSCQLSSLHAVNVKKIAHEFFEKIMCKRLNNYLRSRKLLTKSLYGFRENFNTEDAILEFIDYAYDSIIVSKRADKVKFHGVLIDD